MIYVLHDTSYSEFEDAIRAKVPNPPGGMRQLCAADNEALDLEAVSDALASCKERSLIVWHLGDLALADKAWRHLRIHTDLSVLAVSNEPAIGAYHYSAPDQRPMFGDDRLVLMADRWRGNLGELAEAVRLWSDGESLWQSCRDARLPLRTVSHVLWPILDECWASGDARATSVFEEAAAFLTWLTHRDVDEIVQRFPDLGIGSSTELIVVDQVSVEFPPSYKRDIAGPTGLRALISVPVKQLLGASDEGSLARDDDELAAMIIQKLSCLDKRARRRVVLWHLNDLPFPLKEAAALLRTGSVGIALFSGAAGGVGDVSLSHRMPAELEQALRDRSFPNLVGLYESLHVGTSAKTGKEEQRASRMRLALNRWGQRSDSDQTGLATEFAAAGLRIRRGPSSHAQASVLSFALMACQAGIETQEAATRLSHLADLYLGAGQSILRDLALRIEALDGKPADPELLASLQQTLRAVRSLGEIAHG